MKPFEIIIHSIFILLSIISLVLSFIYNEQSGFLFLTGMIIVCTSAVILLSGEKRRNNVEKYS